MGEPAMPVAAEHVEAEARELDGDVESEDRQGVVEDEPEKELLAGVLVQVAAEPSLADWHVRHDGNYK